MITFRATAFNDKGFTFEFRFQNTNWCEIDKAAATKLAQLVANDSMHQKNGPWNFRNVDRA